MPDNEKQFESDIEAFLVSKQGGCTKASDAGYRSHAAKAGYSARANRTKLGQDVRVF
ncbi:MAG: hypothetical protein IKN64_11800 [Desulfovibrio sp.]|nr:hypothetical protein [Desulfovibrio sp.]